MADVVSIHSFDRDSDDRCSVVAVVDDAVTVAPASYSDPAEYGAALCRGSFYIQDDEMIPTDHAELCEFVGERVVYWEVIDTSDY